MTILIVDDHPIVRKGIHALLTSAFADAEVMDASCLKEAEEACSTRDVNIMITDLDLNGESGLTLIRRVRDILPNLQIVIYTMHEEPWSVCQIADIDTEGVVMKSDNASELVKAVKNLNEGKGHYSTTFVRLLNGLKLQPGRLSEREQQVIDLTAKGPPYLRHGSAARHQRQHRRVSPPTHHAEAQRSQRCRDDKTRHRAWMESKHLTET